MNPSYTVFARFWGRSNGNWRNRLASAASMARRPRRLRGLVGGRALHMRSPAGVRAAGGGNRAVGGKRLEDSTGGNESLLRAGPPGRERSLDRGGSLGDRIGPNRRRRGGGAQLHRAQ